MIDLRFHASSGPAPLARLLRSAGHGGDVDSDLVITGVSELDIAGPGELSLASGRKYVAALEGSAAGAVIVERDLLDKVPPSSVAIPADRPHELFADVLDLLYPTNTRHTIELHGATSPLIEDGVVLGANVVLGEGCEIGRNTVIGPNTVIGAGVAIGRDCIIGSNCTISCAYLGSHVVLHAGVRIGSEGFGWLDFGSSNRKIPQLGRVIVQDRVEIGANSTIDRGALGDTIIGEGTKIDNLVQIGHNCRVGRNCLIAAMSGLSGGTVLEDGVLMGGGAGTSGHLTIGAGTVVRGRSAVIGSWPAGSDIAGTPARDIKEAMREVVAIRRLLKGEKS